MPCRQHRMQGTPVALAVLFGIPIWGVVRGRVGFRKVCVCGNMLASDQPSVHVRRCLGGLKTHFPTSQMCALLSVEYLVRYVSYSPTVSVHLYLVVCCFANFARIRHVKFVKWLGVHFWTCRSKVDIVLGHVAWSSICTGVCKVAYLCMRCVFCCADTKDLQYTCCRATKISRSEWQTRPRRYALFRCATGQRVI